MCDLVNLVIEAFPLFLPTAFSSDGCLWAVSPLELGCWWTWANLQCFRCVRSPMRRNLTRSWSALPWFGLSYSSDFLKPLLLPRMPFDLLSLSDRTVYQHSQFTSQSGLILHSQFPHCIDFHYLVLLEVHGLLQPVDFSAYYGHVWRFSAAKESLFIDSSELLGMLLLPAQVLSLPLDSRHLCTPWQQFCSSGSQTIDQWS